MPRRQTLSAEEIQARLDTCLEIEFSFLKTGGPSQILARLDHSDQEYILNWVERVASTNIQLAYQFISRAISALDRLDKRIIEAWALHAMDTYDQVGLHPALIVIRNVDDFVHLSHERASGAVFEDEAGVLRHFAHGLSGRQLRLQEAEDAYTDSETIFLPPILAQLSTREDNFLLYKAMVAYFWAQTRFGTFRIRLRDYLEQQSDPETFLALFHSLETLRLEACIGRELPGLYRDLQRLKHALGQDSLPEAWQALAVTVSDPKMRVDDVIELTQSIRPGTLAPLPPTAYQGILRPEMVEACLEARLEKEKAGFRSALLRIAEDLKPDADSTEPAVPEFKTRRVPDPNSPDGFRIEITLDGQPMALPVDVKGMLTSIQQDLGDLPDDYLVPAGPGEYDPGLFADEAANPDDVWQGTYHEEGAFLYKEWDYRRQHYRKNWCAAREKDISPVYDDFADKTLRKYSGLVKQLRRTFEAMRDEDKLWKRQVHGDGVDIDALVEALADARDGSEMSDRLFTRMHRTERNIAVVFMVDMSGSTKGWINDAERESLLLLAEALETLGDRYAIYGFSGMARKRCELYKIKTFDEDYGDEIKARISGIQPQDYTRMGFAIRHLTQVLNEVDARTRVLITISDGKPDDYDSYRGQYGIEDTRRALVEARREGIHPYCITIDTEAKDYLSYMYGDAGFTVVDEVYKLPLKVSDIYRRLTT